MSTLWARSKSAIFFGNQETSNSEKSIRAIIVLLKNQFIRLRNKISLISTNYQSWKENKYLQLSNFNIDQYAWDQ